MTAGAGLSAAAGFDYTDRRRFAEAFPALRRLGFGARYELIGYPLPPALLWGYSSHTSPMSASPGPHRVYEQLWQLLRDREHFVLTSNVDALFARNGFDSERVYTPQGDYARLQCLCPCTRQTWAWKNEMEAVLASVDPDTGEVTDPGLVPSCASCDGPVFLNVNLGPHYVPDPYLVNGPA